MLSEHVTTNHVSVGAELPTLAIGLLVGDRRRRSPARSHPQFVLAALDDGRWRALALVAAAARRICRAGQRAAAAGAR